MYGESGDGSAPTSHDEPLRPILTLCPECNEYQFDGNVCVKCGWMPKPRLLTQSPIIETPTRDPLEDCPRCGRETYTGKRCLTSLSGCGYRAKKNRPVQLQQPNQGRAGIGDLSRINREIHAGKQMRGQA